MIVTCEKCATGFEVDDARITERGVKMRCGACGHVFIARREATPPPPVVYKDTKKARQDLGFGGSQEVDIGQSSDRTTPPARRPLASFPEMRQVDAPFAGASTDPLGPDPFGEEDSFIIPEVDPDNSSDPFRDLDLGTGEIPEPLAYAAGVAGSDTPLIPEYDGPSMSGASGATGATGSGADPNERFPPTMPSMAVPIVPKQPAQPPSKPPPKASPPGASADIPGLFGELDPFADLDLDGPDNAFDDMSSRLSGGVASPGASGGISAGISGGISTALSAGTPAPSLQSRPDFQSSVGSAAIPSLRPSNDALKLELAGEERSHVLSRIDLKKEPTRLRARLPAQTSSKIQAKRRPTQKLLPEQARWPTLLGAALGLLLAALTMSPKLPQNAALRRTLGLLPADPQENLLTQLKLRAYRQADGQIVPVLTGQLQNTQKRPLQGLQIRVQSADGSLEVKSPVYEALQLTDLARGQMSSSSLMMKPIEPGETRAFGAPLKDLPKAALTGPLTVHVEEAPQPKP